MISSRLSNKRARVIERRVIDGEAVLLLLVVVDDPPPPPLVSAILVDVDEIPVNNDSERNGEGVYRTDE